MDVSPFASQLFILIFEVGYPTTIYLFSYKLLNIL